MFDREHASAILMWEVLFALCRSFELSWAVWLLSSNCSSAHFKTNIVCGAEWSSEFMNNSVLSLVFALSHRKYYAVCRQLQLSFIVGIEIVKRDNLVDSLGFGNVDNYLQSSLNIYSLPRLRSPSLILFLLFNAQIRCLWKQRSLVRYLRKTTNILAWILSARCRIVIF